MENFRLPGIEYSLNISVKVAVAYSIHVPPQCEAGYSLDVSDLEV